MSSTGADGAGLSQPEDLTSLVADNLLLAQLPDRDRDALASSARLVALPDRAGVHRAGDRLDHVLFPLDGMVSLVRTMEDGTSIETGVVGREGFVDVGALLGGNGAITDALVQIGGRAAAVPTESFREAVDRAPGFRQILDRYTRGVMAAMGQGAACNRLHPLDQRLARWLAMCHRRAPRESFPFTHQFLAEILGVRRASVSEVMQNLQAAGILDYGRGLLRILDPARLEERGCECLRVMEEALQPTPDRNV